MKRPILVLVLGLLAALVGYAIGYLSPLSQRRAMLREAQPELAWLRQEFALSAPEFTRITALHEGYKPQCAEMCRMIEARKAELRRVLAHTNAPTAEMDGLLADIAQLRLQCHQNMLRHFLEVSRAMPPEQGRRYLDWVQSRTLLGEEDMARYHRHH